MQGERVELSLVEQTAMLLLNAQDSQHETEAKKAAMMGIAAAKVLEKVLEQGQAYNRNELVAQIKQIKKIKRKARRVLEQEVTRSIMDKGLMTEIPNLLGCDMNYYTAGVTMREYKSDEAEYLRIVESVRAEILEPGVVDAETVCLLWIMRESGCIHDIFSVEEQKLIEQRMIELKREDALYETILEQEFHNSVRKAYLSFLNWKSNLFKNPYLEGVNLLFPFLDRKQAIFIDMVILGTDVENRRKNTVEFLRKNGHTCEEVKMGSETLIKIDNNHYRIWPSTRRASYVPIQGVELLPVYK